MLLTKVVFFVSYIRFAFSFPPINVAPLLPLPQANYQNEFHLRDNFQTRTVQQEENSNIQQQQGRNVQNSAQNFQTNFRGYLGSGINDKLQPPRPILEKPFNAIRPLIPTSIQETIPPTLREAPPFNQILHRNINNPNINNAPPLQRTDHQQPIANYLQNTGQPMGKKSYTIIHPDGTIEQSDNFEEIIKMYPIHTIVKASELKRNLFPINQKPVAIKPQEAYAKNPMANPTVVPLYNIFVPKPLPKESTREILFPNTFKDFAPITSPRIVTNHLIPNTINAEPNDNLLNHKNITKTVLDPNTVNSNNSAIEHDNNVDTISNKTDSEPQIITTASNVPELNTQSNISTEITMTTTETSIPPELNESKVENYVEENIGITSDSNDNLANTIASNDTHTTETALPNNLTESEDENEKDSVDDTESQVETNGEENIDFTPDLDDVISFNDTYDTEKVLANNLNESEDENEKDSELVDDTDDNPPIETKKCDEEKKIDIPNIALLPDNDTESPFWFESDERFLVERLLNNKNTVFFFMPRVNLEKNTTITIYPNGTKIEETRVVKNDGSKPVVTTIITHSGNEELNKFDS